MRTSFPTPKGVETSEITPVGHQAEDRKGGGSGTVEPETPDEPDSGNDETDSLKVNLVENPEKVTELDSPEVKGKISQIENKRLMQTMKRAEKERENPRSVVISEILHRIEELSS